MATANALREARRYMQPSLDRDLAVTADVEDTYRLDPLSHLDMGHVIIRDIETKQPVPFHPYDHEVELIDSWVDIDQLQATGQLRFRNVHEEKSRQMGITWTCAYVYLWALMYHDVALLAQHVDLGRIDDGGQRSTYESLFGRVRYMARISEDLYARLRPGEPGGWPEWQRPADYLHWRQEPEHMIVNRLTGAYVIGRGEEDDPARGGTYDAILADEFARITHDEAVQESYVSACPEGRLYNSTPFGEDNVHARLRTERPADMIFLRHHWSIHPVYSEGLHVAGRDQDCTLCQGVHVYMGTGWSAEHPERAHRYPGKLTSPWYDRMVLRLLDDESIAQELDISYARALSARVYPEFSDELHVLPHIAYDSAVGLEFSIDYGWSPSSTSIGIWQDAIDTLRKIGELEVHEHTPEQVAAALRNRLIDLGVPAQEGEPRFSRQWLMVGDPSGEAPELGTGESLVVQYRKQGLEISCKRYGVRQTIIALKRLLHGSPKPVRYSADTCPSTIKHMKANRWPADRQGHRKEGASAPLNDEHNHMCRADAYYASFKYPAPRVWEGLGVSGFVKDPELPYMRLSQAEARALMREASGDRGLHPNMRL